MTYKIDDFKRRGLYIERPPDVAQESLQGGKLIQNPQIPVQLAAMMNRRGDGSYSGDYSRQDSAVITGLLSAGYSPADVKVTFSRSPMGQFAAERKNGHFDDYLQRTIQKAVAFLRSQRTGPSSITVDFSKRRGNNSITDSGLIVAMGHEVHTERVEWLWPGYIPAGKLTIIAGDPGMGKSTLVSDLVARISRGRLLPSGDRAVTGTCLIASAEDAAEDTIVPRLIASDANLKRVGVIKEIRDEEGQSRYLSFPRDLDILKQKLISTGCRAVVIDPLNAFLERGVDTYKDQDIRSVLHPMEMMAEETGTAILIVAHLTKKEDANALYRIGGSIGFIGAARSVLGVTRTEDDSRVLYSLKSNLSARPTALSYDIRLITREKENDDDWKGERVIHSTTINWLGEVDFNPFSRNGATTRLDRVDEEVESFLRQVLDDGEVECDLIYREAKKVGISKTNLNRVRLTLRVQAVRRGDSWFWSLPATPPE